MKREHSLDIFRGLTLAAMILVNTPGSWSYVYPPLLHAKWHGLTPTDLIFPFFLFIVGAAMFHSMNRIPECRVPWFKLGKRTLLLFLIGFLLNIYPFTGEPEQWRIMGVLQRIALCYCLGAVIILRSPPHYLGVICMVLLIVYFVVMQFSPAPWSLEHNLVRQLDVIVLGASHMYQGFGIPFDPEGLLSTLPATVTLLLGYLTSKHLSYCDTGSEKMRRLLGWELAAIASGLLWHIWQPINKALWTGSYVLVTAGCAWLILAFIVFFHDVLKWQRGFHWAQVYGSNPLFIYILSWLFAATLSQVVRFEVNGRSTSAYEQAFLWLEGFMPPHLASLVFALTIVVIHYLVARMLYVRNIFIKL